MANALYDKYREAQLSQASPVDFDADTIKVMLVKTAQAFSQAHQFVSDLAAGNIVARSAALTTKTDAGGVADADDVTLSLVAAGSNCNIVVYKDTGVDATSQLLAFYDTGTGFPIPTSGGDVQIQWDNTAGLKMFKL